MKIFAFIFARGGSKGLPGKNIKNFEGKPLISHSIEYALDSKLINEIYVSTDDEQIAHISKTAGAKIIKRPDNISGDTSKSEEPAHRMPRFSKVRSGNTRRLRSGPKLATYVSPIHHKNAGCTSG